MLGPSAPFLAVVSCTLLRDSSRAAGVRVSFDPDNPGRSIFPSDLFTVRDLSRTPAGE